jgi:hypothetical protein
VTERLFPGRERRGDDPRLSDGLLQVANPSATTLGCVR